MLKRVLPVLILIFGAKVALAKNSSEGYFGFGWIYENADLSIPRAETVSDFNNGIFLSLGFTSDINPKVFVGIDATWNIVWHNIGDISTPDIVLINTEVNSGTQVKAILGFRPTEETKLYGGAGFASRNGYSYFRLPSNAYSYLDSRGFILTAGGELKLSRRVGVFLEYEHYRGKTNNFKLNNGDISLDKADVVTNAFKIGGRLYFLAR